MFSDSPSYFYPMQRYIMILFILASISISGCVKSKKELITRKWHLQEAITPMGKIQADLHPEYLWDFRADGTYQIFMGEFDEGTWELDKDEKVLITINPARNLRSEIDIMEISEDRLVLGTPEKGVRLSLIPVE